MYAPNDLPLVIRVPLRSVPLQGARSFLSKLPYLLPTAAPREFLLGDELYQPASGHFLYTPGWLHIPFLYSDHPECHGCRDSLIR